MNGLVGAVGQTGKCVPSAVIDADGILAAAPCHEVDHVEFRHSSHEPPPPPPPPAGGPWQGRPHGVTVYGAPRICQPIIRTRMNC